MPSPNLKLDDYDISQHATKIGLVAINWNALHEAYGHIFAVLVSRRRPKLGWAIWSAITNDRTARSVLSAAAKSVKGGNSKFFKELEWAINQTPTLEDNRDTALHAPVSFEIKGNTVKLAPSTIAGHRRAMKLEGKDLSAELTAYANNMSKLTLFVFAVGNYLTEPDDSPSWPERPRLQRVAHSRPRKE